jgi:ATP-dependent Lhr-like helicase
MPLDSFHPACQNWFRASFGEPTPAQARAWPAIQAGRHTLISAPTGSGKTLAAFYAAIDEMLQKGVRNQLEDGVHILYVSPLKALSNDIQRNLELPLDGIAEHMHLLGQAPVDIRAAVRTGDTPANERQKMAKNPPHILVTTPESLYLLLTSASGRAMLANVSTLIVDEIHAMLGDKRGAHLALSIERLEHLVRSNSGQHLRRVGLSATQKPIDMVARYLVSNSNAEGDRVECEIVDSGFRRKLELHLEVPGSPLTALMSNEVWEELYERLLQLIQQHETTLIFVNTRRLSERLALALTDRLGDGSVCSHHGSMSKDHRHAAEQRLKAGQLKVLVATASMELGIDVGSVDLVVQISSPKSIATFLQRVGRSGHSVKGTPKGILFPLTRDDLIESTALLHSIHNGELDRIIMPEKPLDILAQQIVAEVSSLSLGKGSLDDGEGWDLDALYALFANAYSYRDLSREEFDRIIKMLAEGYTSRRGRRGTHLHLDLINNKVRSRRGANLTSLTNGGAIPDMFDYQVVLDPEDVVVGTLNEDFALEALPGDVFTLGTHAWQMLRVDGLKVRVRDAEGMSPTIPFWFGEGPGRTQELSQSVSRLRQTIGELLIDESSGAAMNWLMDTLGLPSSAAQQMVEYLQAGMNALGVMPTRETLVMERFFDEVGDMHVVIHSPYGSRLNRAWGLALRKRFCKSFNFELQAAANEDSIVISLGSVHSFALDEVYRYLQTSTVRDTLIQAMLDAPMFEVRWRWNATRSLAIQRNRNGKRVPPQFQRMDAEDLVAHVFPDQIACQENITGRREVPDHPLVNQTVDDCLTEAMDIDELETLIGNIENNRLTLIAKDLREPSPFAQEIINARPYAFLDDAPFEERRTNAIRNRSWADPADAKDYSQLDAEAIARVKEEAWPFISNPEELHDALLSATYITGQEYMAQELSRFSESLVDSNRITDIQVNGQTLWVAIETLPRFIAVFAEQLGAMQLPVFLQSEDWQPEDALREIVRGRLQCLGPITASRLATELGLKKSSIDQHRKAIKPVSLETYTEFLFDRHQLLPLRDPQIDNARQEQIPVLDGQTQLQNCLQILDGMAAPAVSWEADIYPSRIADYDPNWLDVMCISGKLAWGRYSQPQKSIRKMNRKRSAGPVKSTPITLLRRSNLDIWKALARSQVSEEQQVELSGSARKIADDLVNNGASFYDEIQRRTGLLRTQMEEGLAELVAQGQLSSDSFTGLRALLTPNHRKPGSHRRRGRSAMFGVEDAGRWSLLDTFQGKPDTATTTSRHWQVLDDEQLERLITVYLQRWGVLFRGILDKEMAAPPWRVLLAKLRRMELQGILRGGRFIAGVGGEQFAFAETVDELRKFKRSKQDGAEQHQTDYFCVAATDPANLINFILPGRKLPRLSKNRVLYRGGVPIAVMESGEVHYLKQATAEEQWQWQQMLMKRVYPPRLRNYLGAH